MQFAFKLTPADLKRMLKVLRLRLVRLAGRNPSAFFINLLAWIGFGLAGNIWWGLYRKYPALAPDLTLMASSLAAGLAITFLLFLHRRHIVDRILLAQDGCFLAAQTAHLDQQGLRLTTPQSERHYQWSAFLGMAEDEVNFYLLIDNLESVTLPKLAFGAAEIDQLMAWVQAKKGSGALENPASGK